MFSLGEINIICTDLQKSLHFYRDVLGFEVTEDDSANQAIHMRLGDQAFLLLAVAGSPGQRVPYCAVPTFSIDLMVTNIATAAAHCQQYGVEFVKAWMPDARSFFIADPDGLVWEIIQRT